MALSDVVTILLYQDCVRLATSLIILTRLLQIVNSLIVEGLLADLQQDVRFLHVYW